MKQDPAAQQEQPEDTEQECITIHGARVHNLQSVHVEIPRDQFTVITGPSGSGKSSLAFDTLYAEGQRQYIESLSVYARQFLHQLERPDVDWIEGLQPTLSIEQRSINLSPRSTVGTITEVYDYLRLLMARVGTAYCPETGEPIDQQTPEQIQEAIARLPRDTKFMILAPMVRGRKGQHREVFEQIRKAGLLRVRIDGIVYELDNLPDIEQRKKHDIEAVLDRLKVREGFESRLADSVELALKYGEGSLIVSVLKDRASGSKGKNAFEDTFYNTRYANPTGNLNFEELEPRTFSFNSPYGACPKCEGLGTVEGFDPELVVPDWDVSLAEGAVVPWKNESATAQKKYFQWLDPLLKKHRATRDTRLGDLSETARQKLIYGDGKSFEGLLIALEKQFATTRSKRLQGKLAELRSVMVCPECSGARLRREARAVKIQGKAIHEITALPISEAMDWLKNLEFAEEETPVARPILREICSRLAFLDKVGVSYLALNRPADTLSGGEAQRVRLATSIGSGLVGVCYVLDEPSIGLHPRDNQRLIDALTELQAQGNTVIVVEHDESMMRQADHLIDMGPGAGTKGGQIVALGTPAEVQENSRSITGSYLSGKKQIEVPARRRRTAKSRSLFLEGASANNLKGLDVQIPLNTLVCVTGVSGSGKSSLVNETISRAVARRLGLSAPRVGPHKSLRGVSQIERLVPIDQSPIGRTPRSNPATYTGIFDEVRKVFAGTRQAKQLGYKVGRFSFNVKGGRCEQCQGQGVKKIEMNFLPDLYVRCPECDGKRFNRQTLQVLYKGLSIADVLDLPIAEAVGFFENFPVIDRMLRSLHDVGLGYLTLGQRSTTLSGGEAQRIKLAAELGRVDSAKTLYILDEPTTGLHFDDIRRLLTVLQKLVDAENSVLVIEHNLDIIKSADWIIDMGPEGGSAGGEVVATGTPEEIAALSENHTGKYLAKVL